MSGQHAELYSYALYLNIMDEKFDAAPFQVIDYKSVNGEDPPYFYLDNWKYQQNIFSIQVIYLSSENKFKLIFFDKSSENIIPDNVSDILLANKFEPKQAKFELAVNDDDEVKKCLKTLCESCKYIKYKNSEMSFDLMRRCHPFSLDYKITNNRKRPSKYINCTA